MGSGLFWRQLPRLPRLNRGLELGNVVGSDPSTSYNSEFIELFRTSLLEYDDPIKTYLKKNPDLPLNSVIKIVFSYYITPKLIVQLDDFKNHLKNVNFYLNIFTYSHLLIVSLYL